MRVGVSLASASGRGLYCGGLMTGGPREHGDGEPGGSDSCLALWGVEIANEV